MVPYALKITLISPSWTLDGIVGIFFPWKQSIEKNRYKGHFPDHLDLKYFALQLVVLGLVVASSVVASTIVASIADPSSVVEFG